MRVFVSTADASGDLHSAALVTALRKRLAERGEPLELYGLGGEALLAAGLEPIVEQRDFAVAGLFEVASSLPRILSGMRALKRAMKQLRPDLVLLSDSPDLNLPLARVGRKQRIPVLYYVAPQVWAWRSGRIRLLRERVTHLGVIFPFEAALFNQAGVPASFVGHPLVDRMTAVQQNLCPKEVAEELGIDTSRPLLALLPGSRRNEVAANLARMRDTAQLLMQTHPDLQARLLVAPNVEDITPEDAEILQPIRGRSHEVMAIATALLVAPGTVTIEAALLGTPMVVTHELNSLSFEIARRLTRIPSGCMVNLIADRGIVPERIQDQARPTALAAELSRLLRDPIAREEQREELAQVAARLGGPGAPERAAALALEVAGRR